MEMTIRNGLLALMTTALVMACGGSAEEVEPLSGGQSRLDGKKDPNKPAGDDTTKPSAPSTSGACFWDGDGSRSCKSPDDWKDFASQACKAKGAELTDLVFGESCEKTGHREAKFECCTAGAPPKDPGPVPPKDPPKDPGEPAPSSCIDDSAHKACQSEAAWKDYASQVCAKQGLQLTDVGYGAQCGKNGEIGEIKFTCCK